MNATASCRYAVYAMRLSGGASMRTPTARLSNADDGSDAATGRGTQVIKQLLVLCYHSEEGHKCVHCAVVSPCVAARYVCCRRLTCGLLVGMPRSVRVCAFICVLGLVPSEQGRY